MEIFQVIAKERAIAATVTEVLAARKKETQREAQRARKTIKFLNEKPQTNLKAMHIFERVVVILEINKGIDKNQVCLQAANKLEVLISFITTFDSKFDQSQRARLPTGWGIDGSLFSWEAYEHELTEKKVQNGHLFVV